MPDVLRNDLFELNTSIPSGFYQVYKNRLTEPEFYFDNLLVIENENTPYDETGTAFTIVDASLYYGIESGDIVSITQGKLRVILSRKANHNTLLITERCNNLCLFCSQPPRKENDSWLLDVAKNALAAFKLSGIVGISGGEPLLYGDEFVHFLEFVKEHSPETTLHVLTNGRQFADLELTQKIAYVTKDMSISFGIPLYSAIPDTHNQLVANENAFDETVLGIINAGNSGINIELRFIPTQLNYQDLPAVIELTGRVFSNINQISVMNLEATGWARRNWNDLYIAPERYQDVMQVAINVAECCYLPIVLFNYPLCHLHQEMWLYSIQSISDWKNYYPQACNHCRVKHECGGYFSSSYGKYHQEPRAIV
ncbi:His-Xaa-Ser system radical SAM maturase HxsC [Providencia sp. PROV202]|uniref:His-Xaa-Ser system radical SAM maturase HxsC n=1 Tax=Providencia sp. PROV202 TaxID=2949902 RepID=UPI00234A9EFF|nr:His-Xaa-Ser system radical SAM maturase HxsC [Providencia sp. PROV202]